MCGPNRQNAATHFFLHLDDDELGGGKVQEKRPREKMRGARRRLGGVGRAC